MSLPKRSSSCPLDTVRKLKYGNGIYEGDIKQSRPHGFGVYQSKDGYVYSGLFLSGKFRRGRKTSQSCYWDGEWDDLSLKSGSQYNEDGSILSGSWVNGKLEGPVTKISPNGDKLYFQYKYSISLGFAKLEYKNGDILTSIVIDDTFHGYCQLLIKKSKDKILLHGVYHDENVILNLYYENGKRRDLNYKCQCK